MGSHYFVGDELSPFNRSMLDLLEKVEYRSCDSGEDIEAVRRLRYRSYFGQGFIDYSADGKYDDGLDDASNAYLFGVYIDGMLASTLRIHNVTKAEPDGPAMRIFADVIGPRLKRGETFVHPSQFAAEPNLGIHTLAIPYLTMRLTVVATAHFKATGCVGVIRAEHAAFYQRIFEAKEVAEPRFYTPTVPPAHLYIANRAESYQTVVERFPFVNSTPREQRMLFGRRAHAADTPLTVLPTAKYALLAA